MGSLWMCNIRWIMCTYHVWMVSLPRSDIPQLGTFSGWWLFSRWAMSDDLWPHASLPCPLLSPAVCSNPCPSSLWCHPTVLSPVALFASFLWEGNIYIYIKSIYFWIIFTHVKCLSHLLLFAWGWDFSLLLLFTWPLNGNMPSLSESEDSVIHQEKFLRRLINLVAP